MPCIVFDAIFILGPLDFWLLSFSINLCGALAFLPSQQSFERLAAPSKKKLLTIHGITWHGNPG
jgi:hypothetical protein